IFANEIVPERVHLQTTSGEQTQNIAEKEKLRKQHPYGCNIDGVSEEDRIREEVESGVAVYHHELSGDGKRARVKEYDKDAEIIYLHNATPNAIIGKSVYK